MKVYLVSYFNENQRRRVYLPTTFDKWSAIEEVRKRPTGRMHVMFTSVRRLRKAATEEKVL